MTLLITTFIDHLHDSGTTPATLKALRCDLHTLVRWYDEAHHGRTLRLADITPRDVQHWMAHSQTGKDVAPATANRRKNSLRRLCAWAIAAGDLVTDPTRDVKDLPSGTSSPRSVSDAAIDRVLHAARQTENPEQALRDEAMLSVLAYCGLRVEELCQLLLSDYNPVTRKIFVRLGKGGKSRAVFLRREAQPVVERYLRQVRCPGGYPTGKDAEEPLWMHRANGTGRPWAVGIQQRAVQERVRYLASQEASHLRADAALSRRDDQRVALERLAAELDIITPHTFRHSLARRLLKADADLAEIQAVLGHSNLRVTSIYLTPSEQDIEQSLEDGSGLR